MMKKTILVLIFSLLYNLNCSNSEDSAEPQDEGLDVDLKGNETAKMKSLNNEEQEANKNSEDSAEPQDEGLDVDLKGNETAKMKSLNNEEQEANKNSEDSAEPQDEGLDVDLKGNETAKMKSLNNEEQEANKIDKQFTQVVDYKINENYDENKVKGVINHFPGGDLADLFGTNQHYNIPVNYQDFGRRFVFQYPYTEKKSADEEAEDELHNTVQQYIENKQNSQELLPIKAPPEFVLDIAKKSAILEASKPRNPTDDIIHKDILRSGDYFNDVWKEKIDPKKLLRTSGSKNNLESVTVEIKPGSKLYNLISMLKEKSPRLIYVINKDVY